jgi:hypothetical protein
MCICIFYWLVLYLSGKLVAIAGSMEFTINYSYNYNKTFKHNWGNTKAHIKAYNTTLMCVTQFFHFLYCPCLYLYLYFNFINPYWLPKPSDIEHVTYAYISSKPRTNHITTTFMKETATVHNLANSTSI